MNPAGTLAWQEWLFEVCCIAGLGTTQPIVTHWALGLCVLRLDPVETLRLGHVKTSSQKPVKSNLLLSPIPGQPTSLIQHVQKITERVETSLQGFSIFNTSGPFRPNTAKWLYTGCVSQPSNGRSLLCHIRVCSRWRLELD